MSRIHVRGLMGVQILQVAVGLSKESDKDPDDCVICINNEKTEVLSSERLSNKLHHVFDARCRVVDIDCKEKTPYWVEGAATSIFENRENIFKFLVPRTDMIENIFPFSDGKSVAVHIRGNDKNVASVESCRKLLAMAGSNAMIYTDDKEKAKSVSPDHQISKNELDIDDWIDMYNSPIIYAAPSAFIMSMLVFNPTKKMIFMNEKMCDGEYPASAGDFLFLREAMKFCPNVYII